MRKTKENLLSKDRDEIIRQYQECWSVSEILINLYGSSKCSGSRRWVTKILEDEGIYLGSSSTKSNDYCRSRVEKIKATCLERYGVDNISKVSGYGWKNNDVKKTELCWMKDYDAYCRLVDLETRRNKKKMISADYCYYTGIKFADSSSVGLVNPNDPLKRSVDHKISKLFGFMTNIHHINIGSVGNLVFCLKYCNTMKNNMSCEQFKPFAEIIREKMIHEGKESI